jgi:hypothetical protein
VPATQHSHNRSLNSTLLPLTASAGLSASFNTFLQAYLHPPGSPLMSTSAVTLGQPPLSIQQPGLLWNPPDPPPAGSTNDRHVARATTVHTRGVATSPFQSLTSGQHSQSLSSLQRVQSCCSMSSSHLPRGISSRKYVVVIHPEPVSHCLRSGTVLSLTQGYAGIWNNI